ncbi:MAG: hydrogenase iron-sulfur subunit [Deltaproteobacteria bacterium]|nr:hydrogenase iron-sulfur subunit [Deltaproteobacteria bacterium]
MKTEDRRKRSPNIILFLCNWSPHAAYQNIQNRSSSVPEGIKMVRIPCTGRISKALLFKPFEMGADGVALVGCKEGSCRYGKGTETALNNVEDTRSILELMGLGKGRLRLATFLPEEAESLLQFLKEFHKEISAMEKSPVTPPIKENAPEDREKLIKEIIELHNVYACQECGKCSSACPLSLAGKPFSPRAMAGSIIAGDTLSVDVQQDIWSCLTCGLCYDRCPSAVKFPEFIRDMRYASRKGMIKDFSNHGGFFHSIMRTMASENLKTNHWEWLPGEIKTDPASEVLYFGGCAPIFDNFFRKHLKVKTSDILVDSLRLLNFFDISPAIFSDERCCGHDLLWTGDKENFLKLAKKNVKTIHERGIKELITSCPECYRTFSHDYPEQGIEIKFKVTHIYDLLEREIGKGAVSFKKFEHSITFQDPCRLSRFEGRPDLPRKLLSRLDTVSFKEMQDFGANAICCGNVGWTGCDSFSKAMQVKRIRQAHSTGSDVLVTACPKCQIHLQCAMEDPFIENELTMEMRDLTSILANTIRWE